MFSLALIKYSNKYNDCGRIMSKSLQVIVSSKHAVNRIIIRDIIRGRYTAERKFLNEAWLMRSLEFISEFPITNVE